MKKRNKYFIVISLFIISLFIIILIFINKYSSILDTNKAKNLLEFLYTLKEGNYQYKEGYVLTENNSLVKNKKYLSGNGNIHIDKYGNVEFYINYDNKCIYKNLTGNITSKNSICNSFNKLDIKVAKNNNQISFISNKKNLEYKISNKDDFKGEWIKKDYKDNFILNYYKEGTHYIWFKSEDGILSDAIQFNIECLNTRKAQYDSNVLYCNGSTIILSDIEWVVIDTGENAITLMKYLPIKDNLYHCTSEKSEYCFYTQNEIKEFKWSNSYVNYYLNNVYIDTLSDDIKDRLITKYICDEYELYNCEGESCGGNTKEIINENNWVCTNYTPSKIRLISYYEFNSIVTNSKSIETLNGNYWTINSFTKNYGSVVQNNYEFYILEDLNNKLNVKPVITITK